LTGPLPATDAFLRAASTHLRAPVLHVACEEGLRIASAAKTLVLRNVDALADPEQQALLEWLDKDAGDRAQVISQTAASLYTLVQAGQFQDGLYYRLNVIHLQIASE
jgi:DNA-binding NtrC family response regulator